MADTPLDRTDMADDLLETKAVKSKSQSRIVWEQFIKHKAALVGGAILIIMYLATMFAGFIAPYGINEYRRFPVTANQPPTPIHWRNAETGAFTRPYVYLLSQERDPVTRQRIYVEDVEEGVFPIKFFVRRPDTTYKVLGLFESDLHLFGVDEPARVFLWGTNNLGKDVFSRVLYGGQISLTVGLIAVWVAFFLGLLFGGLAGFYGGVVDNLIMRFIEVIDAIPGLFLLITLAALLRDPRNPIAQAFGLKMTSGQVFIMIVVVLGFIGWGGLARVVRGQVLTVRDQDYAQAAKALGASESRIMWLHLIPSTASYVIVSLTLAIPGFILGEVALSFLGLGPSNVDTSSWGLLLKDATDRGISIQFTPWLLIPGIPIFLAILSWNLVGDGLRDAFDPKKRR